MIVSAPGCPIGESSVLQLKPRSTISLHYVNIHLLLLQVAPHYTASSLSFVSASQVLILPLTLLPYPLPIFVFVYWCNTNSRHLPPSSSTNHPLPCLTSHRIWRRHELNASRVLELEYIHTHLGQIPSALRPARHAHVAEYSPCRSSSKHQVPSV